jgi:hypothetical protein
MCDSPTAMNTGTKKQRSRESSSVLCPKLQADLEQQADRGGCYALEESGHLTTLFEFRVEQTQ